MNLPEPIHGPVTLLGRLLLALVWLPSGFSKIGNFAGTQQFMASVGMPATGFMLVCAIIIEIVAAAMILVGFKTRWAALALIAFMILANYYFHLPWKAAEADFMNQMIHFSKNNAITGALLLLLVNGPGRWSVDGRKSDQ